MQGRKGGWQWVKQGVSSGGNEQAKVRAKVRAKGSEPQRVVSGVRKAVVRHGVILFRFFLAMWMWGGSEDRVDLGSWPRVCHPDFSGLCSTLEMSVFREALKGRMVVRLAYSGDRFYTARCVTGRVCECESVWISGKSDFCLRANSRFVA